MLFLFRLKKIRFLLVSLSDLLRVKSQAILVSFRSCINSMLAAQAAPDQTRFRPLQFGTDDQSLMDLARSISSSFLMSAGVSSGRSTFSVSLFSLPVNLNGT